MPALLILLMSCAPTANKNKKRLAPATDYRTSGAAMPLLKMVTGDGSILTNDSLTAGNSVFLMLFNPTCDHCALVTDTLLHYYDHFKRTQLYLIAGDNMAPYLPEFIAAHHLKDYPDIKVGVDSAGLIQKILLYESLPQVNVYDSTHHLMQVFTGLQPAASYLPWIR